MLLLACVPLEIGEDSAPVEGPQVEIEQIPGLEDPSAPVFDPTRVADLALTMDPTDWLDVRDDPWSKHWVQADFQWGEERVEQIGVRAFGSGSVRAGKPSLKLSFDRNLDGQTWRGLDELKLDNSSQDPGFLNERVATAALRRAGVPASRTGWARVTVNGDYAGFFVVLESVDDRFVERWFGHDDGPLYSMNAHNWGQGLNPMQDPLTWYEPETSYGGDGSELALAADRLAHEEISSVLEVLDLEGFFRESIARSVMGSLDAFSADGNNFYLFVDEGRVRIIPWDFDVDLGSYYTGTALTVDPRAPWLTSPWSYNSHSGAPYTDPVLLRALEEGYDPEALVAELIEGPLSWERMDADAKEAAGLIANNVHEDVFGYGPAFDRRRHDLRLFLHARWSVLAGQEVAPCPAPGGLVVSELSPSGSVGWGELLIDATNWGPGFNVAGEHYCTGLFAHAPSTVTLELPQGGVLSGAAGLQDWNQTCGDGAAFQVSQGELLWESPVLRNYDPAEAFEVEVEEGPVTLTSTSGANYSCDTSVWLDLVLRPS